jgi:hypothetical protein
MQMHSMQMMAPSYSTTLCDTNSAVSDRNTNFKIGRQNALRDRLQMPIRDLLSCVPIGVWEYFGLNGPLLRFGLSSAYIL